MFHTIKLRMWITILLVAAPMLSMISWSCAVGATMLDMQEPAKLQLVVGKSVVIKIPELIKRISIADPAIATFLLISPHEIYITGKASGSTNLTIWDKQSKYQVYDLQVSLDVSGLKQKIHEILPEETDLRVTASAGTITLSGKVSNSVKLSQIISLAKAYAPKGKVNNLVEVGGVQQVMLEVRIAEMQRSLVRQLGINFNYVTPSGQFGISQLGGLAQLAQGSNSAFSNPIFGTSVSSAVNALFRFNAAGATWTEFIDALKQDGLVKILAEPTLIALSGQKASFLAGGEFPVPVPQGLGTAAIEYKPFGVGLSFTPTVLSGNKININVAPYVSELDFSTAVLSSGYVVPGLTTRKAQTDVELGDGQSFAIAGLLRNSVRDAVSKFPLLGDLPIIGALFRSRQFQKNETELVIIVTPHLVKPLDVAKQSLPTDYYSEPSDAELYLLGLMEGRNGNKQSVGITGELDGAFGHAMPGKN